MTSNLLEQNLLERTNAAFDGQAVELLRGLLDTDEAKTRAGLNVAIPAMVGELVAASDSESGKQCLFTALDDFDGGLLHHLNEQLGSGQPESLLEKGEAVLQTLLGDRFPPLVDQVGEAGIAHPGKLLPLVAPVVLSVIGKQRRDESLDMAGVAQFLQSQHSLMAESATPGASVAGLAKRPSSSSADVASSVAADISSAATRESTPDQEPSGLVAVLIPLVLLACLAGVGYKSIGPGSKVNSSPAEIESDGELATEVLVDESGADEAEGNSEPADSGKLKESTESPDELGQQPSEGIGEVKGQGSGE